MKSLESLNLRQASFLPEVKTKEHKDKRNGIRYFHQDDVLIIQGFGMWSLSSENLPVIRVGKKGHPYYKAVGPFKVYCDSKSDELEPGWTIHALVKPHLRPVKKDKTIRI